jgi:hypothetical protein
MMGEAVTDTPVIPDLESARAAWASADEESAFWRDQYESLATRFPDRFVAVADGTVVATSTDLADLVAVLERQGLDVRRTWVRFVAATPRHLAL